MLGEAKRGERRWIAVLSPAVARAIAIIVAPVAVLALLRVPALLEPAWYGDEGIFAAIAHDLRSGQTLYADAWDNKPPLIFLTYAGIQSVFGTGVFPLHLAATVSLAVTQALLAWMAWRLYGAAAVLAAGLTFALVLGTPLIEANLALTETFMVLPTTAAVALCVAAEARPASGRLPFYAVAGVCLGLAANFKQVAVFDAAALAFMLWVSQPHRLRSVGALAAGALLPQLAFAAYFAATGAFGAYVYAVVGSLGLYAGVAPEPDPLLRFAAFIPAVLAARWLMAGRSASAAGFSRFAPVWLGFAVAGAAASPFSFPHYLQQAVPAFALCTGMLVTTRPVALRPQAFGLTLLAFSVALSGFWGVARERKQIQPVRYYRNYVRWETGRMSDYDYRMSFDGKVVAVDDIARVIREDGGGGTLFAWSELPWLYGATGLENPTRYSASFLVEFIPSAREEIMTDLHAAPPDYIVMSDAAYAPFTDLEHFVAERYVLVHAQGDWRVYRLHS